VTVAQTNIVVARFVAHYNGWVGPSSLYSYDIIFVL
jgi:hypothetical protein